MNTNLLDQLVAEYNADPNCRPYDWIWGEAYLTVEEKIEFIRRTTKPGTSHMDVYDETWARQINEDAKRVNRWPF